MAGTSIQQAGLQGLRDSLFRAENAAARIAQTARSPAPPEQVTEALVDLRRAEIDAAMSAKVIEAGNRTLGSLIDILV